jgi:2-phosphoglycerate kinase
MSIPEDFPIETLLSTHGIADANHDLIPISISSIYPKTREEFLKGFGPWVATTTRAQDKPPVLWLAGPSGIGKTTIQLRLARHWSKEGRVLASCFF